MTSSIINDRALNNQPANTNQWDGDKETNTKEDELISFKIGTTVESVSYDGDI